MSAYHKDGIAEVNAVFFNAAMDRAELAEKELEQCRESLRQMDQYLIGICDDVERLHWIQDALTLHESVELSYLVDAYQIEILRDGTPISSTEGTTIRDAIDAMRLGGK